MAIYSCPFRIVVLKNDSSWREELWGMKLGNTVSTICSSKTYADRRDELEAMGFIFHPSPDSGGQFRGEWSKVKLALETYKRIHGDLYVPRSFMIAPGQRSCEVCD
jgi:hypothetical protein